MSLHLSGWQNAHRRVFSEDLHDPKRLSGLSGKKISAMLAEEQKKPSKAAELLTTKRALMRELRETVELLPGAKDLINKLNANKIPHAICSNATREFIDHVLNVHGLKVDHIVSIESTNTPKPHPGPYKLACEMLGFSENSYSEIAGFEDSRHGMRAVKDAGLFGVGVLSHNSSESLKACGAKKTFASLAEASQDGELFPFTP